MKHKVSNAKRIVNLLEKDVVKTLGMGLKANYPKITKKFEESWLKKQIKNYTKKKPNEFSLAITLDNKIIGSMGSGTIDYENNSTEIGYWIGKEYWGKGYGTKALNLFIKELNKKHKLKRIVARSATFNPGSYKILEKCGFKLEGTQKKVIKGKTKYHDLFVYSKIQ